MKNITLITLTLVSSFVLAQCPKEDLARLIRLAGDLKDAFSGQYWEEWKAMDMPLLLVDDQNEHVFNADVADTSFHIGCDGRAMRPASFSKNLLATFHLLNSQSTIVVGTPEHTGKAPVDWTVTLLHEHFHQLQFSTANYFPAQKALNLDKGDQTGMWMLNHPFPYEDEEVNKLLKVMAGNLLSQDTVEVAGVLKTHKKLKAQLKELVGDEHYKYFNLQLWQEGYARYMELELTRDWLENFDQIAQDRFTKGDLETLRENQENKILAHLTGDAPRNLKRVYFYALGAAEARLIAKTNPHWKEQYFDSLFTTDHLLVE